jgi:hypothetical protein
MIELIVTLVILGVVLYIVDMLPIDATIKRIIHIVAILVAGLWVLQMLGFWHGFPSEHLR